jgi:Ring finger domain
MLSGRQDVSPFPHTSNVIEEKPGLTSREGNSDIEMGRTESALPTTTDARIDEQDESVVVLPRDWSPKCVGTVCAICLEPYQVGDEVVWSMNKCVCPHAFDRDCLVEYLMQHEDGEMTPCPCCRKIFLIPTDGSEDDDEKR